MHVLLARFDAVVAMAERLPVTPLPEQNRVAAVRYDVIDVRRADVLPFLQALHTERVRFEVLLPGSPPRSSVAAGGSTGSVAAVSSRMLFTVLCTIRNQAWASGMLTGCVWTERHQRTRPHSAKCSKPPS